ncbi:hypothetical protein BU14_0289s0021 [Porphyra umbilicalis]|uniref:Uncharacterized protein n=1 Tax=Porphyra umbilicalis TaxID=2786 RepID=A0A1X6P0Q6_PORUM|nr:hypothetical protein BU14_0289s0021 [Porphyra umbilicalis]|eukprot:OSX74442.1 hypothetical protein BU14_0289s0021 [Porphyra umbilicalis]
MGTVLSTVRTRSSTRRRTRASAAAVAAVVADADAAPGGRRRRKGSPPPFKRLTAGAGDDDRAGHGLPTRRSSAHAASPSGAYGERGGVGAAAAGGAGGASAPSDVGASAPAPPSREASEAASLPSTPRGREGSTGRGVPLRTSSGKEPFAPPSSGGGGGGGGDGGGGGSGSAPDLPERSASACSTGSRYGPPAQLGLVRQAFINVLRKDYTGRIELMQGSVEGLAPVDETDLLIVYLRERGSYKGNRDSALAALNRSGISLEQLERESKPQASYRRHYHCWLSRKLQRAQRPAGFEYKRLLVYEDPGDELTRDDNIVLDIMKCLTTVIGGDVQISSVLIPLSGALLSPSRRKHFVQAAVEVSFAWMQMGLPLKTVKILLPDTDITKDVEMFTRARLRLLTSSGAPIASVPSAGLGPSTSAVAVAAPLGLPSPKNSSFQRAPSGARSPSALGASGLQSAASSAISMTSSTAPSLPSSPRSPVTRTRTLRSA